MKWVTTIAASAVLMLGGTAKGQAQAPDPGQVVGRWYQQYLGHPADPGAMNYWAARLQSEPPDQTLAALLAGPEYYARGGNTDQGLVLGLYRDLLNRTTNVSPQELNYWLNVLGQTGNRAAMIDQFLHDANVNPLSPPAPVYSAPPAPPAPQYAPAPTAPPQSYWTPYRRPYPY